MRITKRTIDALKPADADRVLWDDAMPGFGIRIRAGSTRVLYVTKYRFNGRQRWHTIGRHGELTLAQARKLATDALAAVRHGRDPAAEKRAGVQASTVTELCERYMKRHSSVKKKPASVRNDQLMIDRHIAPKLGRLKAHAVTLADVADLHESMADTPYMANRVASLLSKVFALAEVWGLRPANTNPARGIDRYKESSRNRPLTLNELQALGRALSAAAQSPAEVEIVDPKTGKARKRTLPVESPAVIALFRLLPLVGARVDEIRTLQWATVDLERCVAKLTDSKTGERNVILNGPAVMVLENLERVGGYVIPGEDPAHPLVNYAKPWKRICLRAGLTDCRIHDLRHTHGSVAGDSNFSLMLIAALLGHREVRTSAKYTHISNNPARAASEAVASKIAAAMDGRPNADVIQLRHKVATD